MKQFSRSNEYVSFDLVLIQRIRWNEGRKDISLSSIEKMIIICDIIIQKE